MKKEDKTIARKDSDHPLKLKVCGMREKKNLQGLIELEPDFIGFIFYPKSPRYVGKLSKDLLHNVPDSIHKVGVFVNEPLASVLDIADSYNLNYIQLHGDEDESYASMLKDRGLKIIKAFQVKEDIPPQALNYQEVADYFLFDTASEKYGGSGRQFNWDILEDYALSVPFLLSGGIRLEHIDRIKQMTIPMLRGIDVNSGFELSPALKDLDQLKTLKTLL